MRGRSDGEQSDNIHRHIREREMDLAAAMEEAMRAYRALTPEQRAEHDRLQRESFVRGNIEMDRLDRAENVTRRWADRAQSSRTVPVIDTPNAELLNVLKRIADALERGNEITQRHADILDTAIARQSLGLGEWGKRYAASQSGSQEDDGA